MSSFGGAISHCLRNLLHFRGRDTRSQFWFYILGLFIAQQIVTAIATIPIMAMHFDTPTSVGSPMAGDQQQVTSAFSYITILTAVNGMAAILLLAAAVVRRLHDRGMSGLWGLLPLPFAAFSMVQMNRVFSSFDKAGDAFDHTAFFSVFASNALYMVMLGVLVILLVKASDPGENRFGPPTLI